MRERLITFVRHMATFCALAFGDTACRVEDGWLHSVALVLWPLCTIVALDMWADRINRGRR